MNNLKWEKLWGIATSEPGGDAIITPLNTPAEVLLTWPDGTEAVLCWHGNTISWQFPEQYNPCPGDIAARDAL